MGRQRLTEAFTQAIEHDRLYRPLEGGGSQARKLKLSGETREPDDGREEDDDEVMSGVQPGPDNLQ